MMVAYATLLRFSRNELAIFVHAGNAVVDVLYRSDVQVSKDGKT